MSTTTAPAPAPAPARTDEQRRTALAQANVVRQYRATVKLNMRVGDVRLRDVIALTPPDPLLRTMRVSVVMLAAWQVGPSTTSRLLRRAGVSPSRSLGALTRDQRARLLAVVDEWERGRADRRTQR